MRVSIFNTYRTALVWSKDLKSFRFTDRINRYVLKKPSLWLRRRKSFINYIHRSLENSVSKKYVESYTFHILCNQLEQFAKLPSPYWLKFCSRYCRISGSKQTCAKRCSLCLISMMFAKFFDFPFYLLIQRCVTSFIITAHPR